MKPEKRFHKTNMNKERVAAISWVGVNAAVIIPKRVE